MIERPEFELRRPVRARPGARGRVLAQGTPGSPVQADLDEVLRDPTVDAVIVATPPRTHHAIVQRGAQAGKHVLVEKPLATTSADAVDLVDRPTTRGLVLMPGHTFLYSPPVNKVSDLIREDVLGEVYFVTSSRMNLGKYQPDGVDLRPRAARPLDPAVLARAADRRGGGDGPQRLPGRACPETAFLTLTFASGAHGQRPDLVAGPAQGARDGRSSAAGGWSSTTTPRADEPVRVYDRGMEFEHAGELRRVPAHLPQRRHRRPAGRGAPSRCSLELQDFATRSAPGARPARTPSSAVEVVAAIKRPPALANRGEPVKLGVQSSWLSRLTTGGRRPLPFGPGGACGRTRSGRQRTPEPGRCPSGSRSTRSRLGSAVSVLEALDSAVDAARGAVADLELAATAEQARYPVLRARRQRRRRGRRP